MHDRTGDPPLRRYEAGFSGLARIVVGQQLSIASAAAIWSRLETSLANVTPARLLAMPNDELKAVGLSAAKIRTLVALAEAIEAGKLDLAALRTADDADVSKALVAIPGIGAWTADIYAMFCLGRRDAWAAGDLALQVGVARAFDRGPRVSAAELVVIAERWRPWRGVAARLIWADYARPPDAAAPQRP
ncbi:MAG: DNA-3-methyladenine glycosylase family protein [Hyphomicrobiaceae bacterium]